MARLTMFNWMANAVQVPESRRRLLFTAVIVAVYRLGSWLPAPGVDPGAVSNFLNSRGGHNAAGAFSGTWQISRGTWIYPGLHGTGTWYEVDIPDPGNPGHLLFTFPCTGEVHFDYDATAAA